MDKTSAIKYMDCPIMDSMIIKYMHNNVYLADPRLCFYPTFKRIIDRIPEEILRTIKIILFENNHQRCIQNVNNSNKSLSGIRDIETLSLIHSKMSYYKIFIPIGENVRSVFDPLHYMRDC